MSFNKQIGIKMGTFEAHAIIADAWFKFLGFVAVTAIFHYAATKTDTLLLSSLKWTCYILLFGWCNYQVNKLIWFVYPSSDIENEKPNDITIGVTVWLSSMIMLATYKLVFFLLGVFVETNT
jgi:hypothetical protein